MKEIPLSRGMYTVVDDDVYAWASKVRWYAGSGTRGKWYAARTVRVDGRNTTCLLHRLIAGVEGLEVDHRDGNSLNNQRENLRPVTKLVNARNRIQKHGSTGVRNVWRLPSGRFRVRLGPKDGRIQIGTYDTLEAASLAAEQARLKYYGDS